MRRLARKAYCVGSDLGRRLPLLLALVLVPLTCVPAASQLLRQSAPDFVLRSVAGENVRLSEHLGEVIIINFWASWCGPCRQEMPLLDELYGRYQRAGLTLLSVNLDDDKERAIEMAKTLAVSYPVLLDDRKEVSRSYQVGSMPSTVLIDREGVIRYVSEGFKPGYERRYIEQLRELLNQ